MGDTVLNEGAIKGINLYIKIEQDTLTYNKKVFISDIGKLYCTNYEIVKQVGAICLYTIKDNKDNKYMFSIMTVVREINRQFPGINVVNLGENEFIVDYRLPKKQSNWSEVLKVVLVSFIIFFGAAFTIMAFNEDVSVKSIFELIYKLFNMENRKQLRILEIAYSIGIGLGIITFFNHFSKYKDENDPTPLQIELRKHEEDTNKALLADASREGKMHDI